MANRELFAQRTCASRTCDKLIPYWDLHNFCFLCLGFAHAEKAVYALDIDPKCLECSNLPISELTMRLSLVEQAFMPSSLRDAAFDDRFHYRRMMDPRASFSSRWGPPRIHRLHMPAAAGAARDEDAPIALQMSNRCRSPRDSDRDRWMESQLRPLAAQRVGGRSAGPTPGAYPHTSETRGRHEARGGPPAPDSPGPMHEDDTGEQEEYPESLSPVQDDDEGEELEADDYLPSYQPSHQSHEGSDPPVELVAATQRQEDTRVARRAHPRPAAVEVAATQRQEDTRVARRAHPRPAAVEPLPRSGDTNVQTGGSVASTAPTPQADSTAQAASTAPTPQAASTPAEEPAEVTIDEVYAKAATRCGLQWPSVVATGAPAPQVWQGLVTAPQEPPKRSRLPLAMGFQEVLTASWGAPTAPGAKPQKLRFNIDCVEAETFQLTSFPPMDKTLALHLQKSHNLPRNQKSPFSLSKEPSFTYDKDVAGSAATKEVYMATARNARALNASSLLQGSLKELLEEAGDTPSPQQVKEMKRLTQEMILLNMHSTEWAGRVMSLCVTHERARWLDHVTFTGAEDKKSLLNLKVTTGNLFQGAMGFLQESYLTRKAQEDAAASCIQAPPKPPPPEPRPRPARSTERARPQVRQSSSGSRPPARTAPPTSGARQGARRGGGRPPTASGHRQRPTHRGQTARQGK